LIEELADLVEASGANPDFERAEAQRGTYLEIVVLAASIRHEIPVSARTAQLV
jgi:hypothetical protein